MRRWQSVSSRFSRVLFAAALFAAGAMRTHCALPAGWSNTDIGAPGIAGSASEAGGTFTVAGGGADIWSTADEFQYVYRPVSGDFEVTCRVVGFSGGTEFWRQAGIMARETLATDSRHAFSMVAAGNVTRFKYRSDPGGSTLVNGTSGGAPIFVRLVRRGNAFSAYASDNGVSWVQQGTTRDITMADPIYLGLAVNPRNDGQSTTVTFDTLVGLEKPDMSAWGFSAPVTFAGYASGSSLVNFPVLVELGSHIGGFSYGQFVFPAGDDLRFVDANGALLNHEIERWDSGGTSYAWVQVPELEPTGSDAVRAYWGNASAGLPASATNGAVWSTGYVAVYHLGETGGTAAPDASASGFDGTFSAGMDDTDWVSAVVGNGVDFDGGGDNVANNRTASEMGIGGADPKTVSAWVYTRSFGGGGIFDCGLNVDSRQWCLRTTATDSWRAQHWGGADYDFTYPSLNRWVYFTHTYDGITARTYADGDTLAGSETTALDTANDNRFRIGDYLGNSIDAVIDEVRVSTVTRGTDWLRAEWLNMASNGAFNSYGSVQGGTAVAPRVGNGSGAEPGIGLATLRGELLAGNLADVHVYWGPSDGGTNVADWFGHLAVGPRGNGPFSAEASGLYYGQRYYYRCFASNTNGEDWAESSETFLTLPPVTAEAGLVAKVFDTLQGDSYIIPIANLQAQTPDAEYAFSGVLNYPDYPDMVADYPALTDEEKLSLMWEGVFTADEDGPYTFGTRSDDGSVLYLDLDGDGEFNAANEMIVDNRGGHGMRNRTGEVTLDKGEYAIVIGFYENVGGEGMIVRWKKGGNLDFASLDLLDAGSGDFATDFRAPLLAISNGSVDNLTTTSATCHAMLNTEGAVFDAYLHWGSPDGGTNLGAWTYSAYAGSYTNSLSNAVSAVATGLAANTEYRFRFSASNAATRIWADTSTRFKTMGPPSAINGPATDVTETGATVHGELVDGGGATATVHWGLTDGGTNAANWDDHVAVGAVLTGAFSNAIPVLAGGRYFYRCHVSNTLGEAWADSSAIFTSRYATVSVAGTSVTEGDAGTTSAVMGLDLSSHSASTVLVTYATADASAVAGLDYTAQGGVLAFPPGTTHRQVTVSVTGDEENEQPYEQFLVTVTGVTNALGVGSQAAARILDDDTGMDAWASSATITFDGYTGSETLMDYPALVLLGTHIPGFAYEQFASGSGDDLRFLSGDGTQLLNHEVEAWDTDGDSAVWVQVPRLSGTNTSVQVHWGNPSARALASTTNGAVWSNGYEAVWHFAELGGSVAVDASRNGYDGTRIGDTSTDTDGVVGNALQFGGSSGYVDLPDGFADFSGGITVCAWANTATLANWARIVDFGNGAGVDNILLARRGTSDDVRWEFQNTASGSEGVDADGDPLIVTGQWMHWAATCSPGPANGATMRFYLDGVERAMQTGGSVPPTVTRTSNLIGDSNWANDAFFNGLMDEVRVSRVERSADWLHACWVNMADPGQFYTVSPVDSGIRVIAGQARDVSRDGALLSGQIVSDGGAEAPAAYICWGTADAGTAATGDWDHVVSAGSVAEGETFSNRVSGLTPDALYFFRCYATNSSGQGWSETASPFITGEVTLRATDAIAEESGDPGVFTLSRPAALTGASLRVQYSISGLAANGIDYQLLRGLALIPAGESSLDVLVVPLDDLVGNESNETVEATLVPGPYIVGSPGAGSVQIVDDDVSPVEFPDLVLWLDAGTGPLNAAGSPPADGEGVREWLGQSSHRRIAEQPGGPRQPAYTADGVSAAPGVRFVGDTFLSVPDDDALEARNGQTVFVIFNYASGNRLVRKGEGVATAAGDWFVGPDTYGVSGVYPDGLLGPRSGETRLLTGRYDGSTAQVYHNGELRGAVAVSGTSGNTNALVLGDGGGAGVALDASIAELVLFARALDDTEREQVEMYLLGKYFGNVVFSDIRAPVSATILDPVHVAIDVRTLTEVTTLSVTLWYREGSFGAFSALEMTNRAGNTYGTVVPIPAGVAPTVEYYVVATYGPPAGSTAFWPALGAGAPASFSRVDADPRQAGPSARGTGLTISEIMYHPPAPYGRELEFVEIHNSRPVPRDISRFRLSGQVGYTFPEGTVMAPRSRLVVANDPRFVESFYGVSGAHGPFSDRLSNSGGTVRLRNQMGAVLQEVDYGDAYPWPDSADGAGHSLVLRRPDYGEGFVRAWDASARVHGSPGLSDPNMTDALEAVVLNEVLTHTDLPQEDYIELHNAGSVPVDLTGCRLTDHTFTNAYAIPGGTLPAGGFVHYTETALGFPLSMQSEAVYLFSPDGTRVLDAMEFDAQANGVPLGRFPDGGPEWRVLSSATGGAANNAPTNAAIVINEIMYHPISELEDDEYVELLNRSGAPVDISHWRFTDGIRYTFPSNTVVPAGGYVVVAANVDRLLAAHGGALSSAITFGGFSGSLSDRGERVVLSKPDDADLPDQDFVVVDAVSYADGEPWGKWADGGGSSLELIDPLGDNMRAMNWEASDETGKSTGLWTVVEHTGLVDLGRNAADELHILMEGAGECLIDSIEVFKQGEGNRVPNGTFESGLGGWIIQGTHRDSSLETSEGYQSAQSLHLRSVRRGDNSVNRAEIDLTSALSEDDTATIRARVRWLCGYPGVLLRLHGNWLEAAGSARLPTHLGTPGARNSRYVANWGPAIHDVRHAPVLPAANEAVVVSARVFDPQGLASVELKYRNDTDAPGTVHTLAMNDSGTSGDALAGDGVYSATMPGQGDNDTMAFYVEATDGHASAASNRFPADAPQRECLIMFGQQTRDTTFGIYRLWVTEANRLDWATRQKFSDTPIEGTFVYGDFRVIYNGGGRFRGSPFIRQAGDPETRDTSYVLYVPKHDRLLGSTSFNMDRLESDATYQRERVSNWIADQIDTPFFFQRYVHLYINQRYKGTIYGDSQQPNDDFATTWWPEEKGGELFKIDDWFEFNDAAQVSMEFNANGQLMLYNTTATNGLTVKKKARYRWSWRKEAVDRLDDDYTSFFDMVDAMNLDHTSQEYATLVPSLVDYEEWTHIFAVEHIIRNWDSFGYNRGKNMSTYKPRGGKWQMIMWDLDHSHLSGSTSEDLWSVNCPTIRSKFYQHPPFRRAYWRTLREAVDGPMRAEVCGPVMDANYAALSANGVSVTSPDAELKQWIANRRAYILGQLASVDAPFEITTNGGGDFGTGDPTITLKGTAPVEISTIRVNGHAYAVTYPTVTRWQLVVGLAPGDNPLTVEGLDRWDNIVGTDAITVTFNGQALSPEGLLVINEIMYNPTNAGAEFVEIHNRSATHPFVLGGWRINGIDFVFPGGSLIQPGGYLVAAENQAVYAATYGDPQGVAGVFAGSLDDGGERLQLLMPAESNQWAVIDDVRYNDRLPWPTGADGGGYSLQLIDPAQDNDRIANWATGDAIRYTPGEENSVRHTLVAFPGFRINEIQPVNVDTRADNAGDYDPWIELYNAGGTNAAALLDDCFLTDNYADLTNWAFPVGLSFEAGSHRLVWADGEPGEQAGTNLHADFALNATRGSVALVWVYDGLPLVLDYINYGLIAPDLSYGLYPDGDTDAPKRVFHHPTPGSSNDNTSVVPVRINEWMADNGSTLVDPADPAYEDWIELYNGGTGEVNVSGYTLIDDQGDTNRWAIPDGTVIPAGGFLFIWTDDDAEQTTNGVLHAAFKLDNAGEQIALYTPEGVLVDAVNFGPQVEDVSEGRFVDGAAQVYSMVVPTPGASNVIAALVVCSEYGNCTPARGTNILDHGTNIACAVAGSPVAVGEDERILCVGWCGSGDVSPAGAGTNMSAVVTHPSSLTWLWETNYWLGLGATNGSLDATNGWRIAGSNVAVTATPGPYYAFAAWQGDVAGCTVRSNRITAPMSAPRDITATFTNALAPKGTPLYWLARHGLTGSVSAVEELRDADGDGAAAWEEFGADTDPTNHESVLRIVGIEFPGNGQARIRWQGGAGVRQLLQAKGGLGPGGAQWGTLFTNVPPTSPDMDVLDASADDPTRFYRIRAVRP